MRVRQALHYGLDTDKLIKTALLGNAAAATSFLRGRAPRLRRGVHRLRVRPGEGEEAAVGRRSVSGLKVELVMTDTDFVKDCAPLIKQSWDAIGVSTTLNIGQSGGQYSTASTPASTRSWRRPATRRCSATTATC